MADVILLTAAQADEVRGPSATDPTSVLSPLPLNDGSFYLGTNVLQDPAHQAHWATLSACPVVPYEEIQDKIPTSGGAPRS